MDKIEMIPYIRNTNKNNLEINAVNNHQHNQQFKNLNRELITNNCLRSLYL